ncbi:MAG: type II secretion system F family protein [Atopobiaceae bacterium]|nr:type II secretion system F family protein [Atopobiaceae bacterium]MDO4405100.1 type II secretion system F family protein [Atopobiaceae bacterium]
MKTFKYIARSDQGNKVEGVAEANSAEEAISTLRGDGLIVEKLDEVGDSVLNMDLTIGGGKTKEKALAITCNQFAILLKAGLPITRTLQLIASQTEDKTLSKVLKNAADDVAAGYGLASSLEKNGKGLPVTFIESVRAGEDSGALETVFLRLSKYYEKTSKTKAKVKSALVYPTFVIALAVVVIAIIMIFAVPLFTETYQGMDMELPLPTRIVIGTSHFFTRWWWLLAMIIIGIFIGIKFALKNEEFRLKWSEWGTYIPVLGKITVMGAASEYAGTMSVMMAAGLAIVRAVGVTARSMTNYYMGHSLANTIPALEAGRTLASAMAEEGVFPDLCIEMTAVGEQTGALESTLDVIAEYYDDEVETATANALAILEPAIIVFLGAMVFILLLAVYMPMFSMYGDGGIAG